MKKIGILTLNGNFNYGNKLQNYALKTLLESMNFEVETIWFKEKMPDIKDFIKTSIKLTLFPLFPLFKERLNHFKAFNQYLNVRYYKNMNIASLYDYFVVGSDQVWNWHFAKDVYPYFLEFSPKNKNISYAASFGIHSIDEEHKDSYIKGLNNINHISVRETRGKELVSELTGRSDAEVLIDPTMLLSTEEWDKIAVKPKNLKTDKYILTYFLGTLSEKRKKEIQRIADENGCEIINLLDRHSPFYDCGPNEFVYLEKNAFLICTDSFHSSVFALLYNHPFIIFDREDAMEKMNSRIDTLLETFQLENRKFEDKITKENLEHDYSKAYKILEVEREKSKEFLKKSLNI